MKYLIIMMIMLFNCGCSINAITEGKNYEITWQAAHLIDVAQTVQIAKNPHCHSEGNALTRRFIGEQPSEADVYKWGVGAAVVHYFIFKFIDNFGKDNGDIHVPIRALDTLRKLNTVANNHKGGLRVDGTSASDQARCDRMLVPSTEITVWRF